MSETTRTCTKCNQCKPLAEFYRDKRARGGYRADCKACRIAQQTAYAVANRESVTAYQASYREQHRREAVTTARRWKLEHPDRFRDLMEQYRAVPENQQLARARAKAFRVANPDRRSDYHHRRRVQKLAGPLGGLIAPAALWAKFAYWGNRCWMCGTTEDLTIDHVKPLSKGGLHILANIRPACSRCNTRKRARWPFPLAFEIRRAA
jgi:5-methylcytosine-specific restriction endonuclease McrA